ncbi:myo-inositol-1(or 4)-monophosphatase [Cribrihabitans marinus]|uniref:Inositol-1-monophosphatase n=1 Tax=Cribrihabitans marinus TaxID=1227549 RepID=A0A1H7D2T4_9RHOB|nr:inositol monophosphatase family protein [Cribrihabitans marinus]GGH37614.1 inositol monophosphatase [Cribrihabitans marinus]SEJ96036.1 myo-inositol-1(or 4)-monophosphatase [Cribrihabitans marinus]
MQDIEPRADHAVTLCRSVGHRASAWFRDREALVVDKKGAQDWVSEADRGVERLIREGLARDWPDDGVFGEEHDPTPGTSGFSWVIDPIDGTTNFVNGIPAWTVVLAGVRNGRTEIGIIHDPSNDETFVALRGAGARLNGQPISVADKVPLDSGTVAVGYSNRVEASNIVPVVAELVSRGAMFHRNASGALSLAYVAAGRLLGYLEEHMNAWDCLAGQLLIREAGGCVEDQDADAMIAHGGRVIAGTPAVFDELKAIAVSAWPHEGQPTGRQP